jgi:L-fuconolactonase
MFRSDALALTYDPSRNSVRTLDEVTRWQATEVEPVLDADRSIVDAHHHLWRSNTPHNDYLADDFREDLGGHNVRASVVIETGADYWQAGEPSLRPVSETEYIATLAGTPADNRQCHVAAAYVARADLRLGAAVEAVIAKHHAAAPGRVRGIRHPLRWDALGIGMFGRPDPPRLALDATFREGFARLAPAGLSFDAWLFHPQLEELASLAAAFPETTIIVNHMGGPLGVGPYADKRKEVFDVWRHSMARIAEYPNVLMKIGGIGMLYFGLDFHTRSRPPNSRTMADAWRPYVEVCIERFGTRRCMFESNFPVDKQSCTYRVVWNTFKRLAAALSEDEKDDLFSGTATTAYRL